MLTFKLLFVMKKPIVLILFFLIITTNYSNSQINYNRPCITAGLTFGNGIYGIGGITTGIELPICVRQKIGIRIGAGLDISEKIGFGVIVSPYQFKKWDIIVACDLTRIFGSRYLYHNEEETYSEDVYSFDNTNLLIPSIAFRFPGANLFTFHVAIGWAFGLNSPNVNLISGPGIEESMKNINNRLLGGVRFELGGTFRIRKWKS